MTFLADWFGNLFAIDKAALMVMAVICMGGVAILRAMLDNPGAAFIFYPFFIVMAMLCYAMLQTLMGFTNSGNDWLKAAFIAGIFGNGVGVIAALLVMSGAESALEHLETMDMKKRGKASAKDRIAAIKDRQGR